MTPPASAALRGPPLLQCLGLAALLVLLASILAHHAITAHPRFTYLSESVANQRAILDRTPFLAEGVPGDFPSWRSRMLVPMSIAAVSTATHLTFSQSYVVVRWCSALFALAAFAWLAARHVQRSCWFAGAAAAVLAVALLPTFLHVYDVPTDFPDVGFFAVLTLLALEKKRTLFALVLLVALVNRESAVFATFMWFGLHAFDSRRSFLRETVYCGALGVVSALIVLGLRHRFAVVPGGADLGSSVVVATQPVLPLSALPYHVKNFLARPYFGAPLFHLFGFMLLAALIVTGHWAQMTRPLRAISLAAVVIFFCSVPFANFPELRVYVPSLVLLLFVLLSLLGKNLLPSGPASRI